ncbi:hypothetical protein D3C87_1008680 [compost metagenome]
MAAARLRRVDRARDREHFLALLRREPRGDERARRQRSLDHQRAARQARDEAVALGKVLRERRRAQRQLAHDQPLQRDAVRQVAVPRGVHAVQAGADHRHRGEHRGVAGRVERAQVRRAVDAECQPRDHGQARFAQRPCEGARMAGALRRRVAAADHGEAAAELREVEGGGAEHVEHQRRVDHLEQRTRVAGVAERHDAARDGAAGGVVRGVQPLPGLVDLRLQAGGRLLERGGLGGADDFAQRRLGLREDRVRQPEGREQAACGAVADAWGQ